MKKNITSLEELEKEQEKLKMTMKLTKQAFAENLGTNRYQLKDFLVKNVALPGGAIGLGYAAIKKTVSAVNDRSEESASANISAKNSNHSDASSGWLGKALPLVLSAAQAYFFKQWGKEEVKEDIRQTSPNAPKHTLKKVV